MEIFNKRDKNSHKGDFGKVLIIAGSSSMAGAAILACRASFRTGSGLVYSYIPKDIFVQMQISTPEVICLDRKNTLDFSKYDAVLFGPGMGVSEENRDLLKFVLNNFSGPMVIDADGLNIISKYDLFKLLRSNIVLTPHIGEIDRLIGWNNLSREEKVDKLLEKVDSVVLLKGNNTIVKDKKEKYINETGNPGMAVAGSGDVLSGIIVSLLGRQVSPFDAAKYGAYIHGLSGDLAEEKLGEEGMISSDIVEMIPFAIKKIKERNF